LIIDDWGPEPLNAEQRSDLLEIVDDRCDEREQRALLRAILKGIIAFRKRCPRILMRTPRMA
jgi:hypothetical protein